MSGTEDKISAAVDAAGQVQSGAENVEAAVAMPRRLSTSEKMDLLLRGNSSESMKKEIEKLRRESAKYRISARDASLAKSQLQERSEAIAAELADLKQKHRAEVLMRKFDKAGCIKSELALKDVPADIALDDEALSVFIDNYKKENAFLFSEVKNSHGGIFKPAKNVNLSPSQQMDRIIRSALGR